MPAGNLNRPLKTLAEVQQEAAMAQRSLNDAVFVRFVNEMQEDAADAALFSDAADERERARIKVLMIAELRARLELAAHMPAEQREAEELARSFE